MSNYKNRIQTKLTELIDWRLECEKEIEESRIKEDILRDLLGEDHKVVKKAAPLPNPPALETEPSDTFMTQERAQIVRAMLYDGLNKRINRSKKMLFEHIYQKQIRRVRECEQVCGGKKNFERIFQIIFDQWTTGTGSRPSNVRAGVVNGDSVPSEKGMPALKIVLDKPPRYPNRKKKAAAVVSKKGAWHPSTALGKNHAHARGGLTRREQIQRVLKKHSSKTEPMQNAEIARACVLEFPDKEHVNGFRDYKHAVVGISSTLNSMRTREKGYSWFKFKKNSKGVHFHWYA